jgi:PAS domain S-box-containing protein
MGATKETIRVLHVDDEPDFAELAADFLERQSDQFEVQTATSAQKGLEYLANASVDCVVSDFEMPGMDGIEFLESVRDEYPDLPFLLFTGKGSEAVASNAISRGVTDYLQKRSDNSQFELLANRITNAVDQNRARRVVTKTEQRFQTIADQANDIFWIFNASFDELLFVNSTFEEIWGQSVETIEERPRSLLDGVHPDDRDRVEDAIERVAAGESVDLEFQVNPNEEFSRWVWVTGSPVQNADGEIRTIVGVARDITERKDRERELERMSDLFQQAQKIADLGAWETDLRYEEGWWTEGVNQIYGLPNGYEPDPGEGIEYFHPEDRPVIRDAFERVQENGEPYDLELRVGADEDDFKWIRTRGKPQVEDGEVVRVRGTIQDITDSKERQIELEQANTLLSTLIDTLPHGVLAEDDSRNVLATNDRMFELFDLPGRPEEVIGTDCEHLAAKVSDQFVDPEAFVTRINHVVSEREPIDAEELELADSRTFERSYRPIELPEGEGNLWVYTDITDRKQQQLELETILERMNDAVFVHGEDSSFMFVNETALQRYGYSEDEFSTMTPTDIDAHEDSKQVKERVNRVKEEGELVFETVHEQKSGDRMPVEISATMVTFRGKPAILSIVRDITERKRQERKLRQRNERLDEFASVVSHDLRNPLNVAQGRIDLAKEDCDSTHLDDALTGIDRSLELIDDMLMLAKAGDRVGNIEPVNLGEFIQRCWQNVESETATLEAETDLSLNADETRLQQLMENLLRNAVEHGGDRVTINIGALEDGFYVEDDGPGIPEEKREEVFSAGHSSLEDGTGFGLSIVKEIVDAHGWDIRITEGSEGGARFEITGVEFAPE